jgi:hypothetical protein
MSINIKNLGLATQLGAAQQVGTRNTGTGLNLGGGAVTGLGTLQIDPSLGGLLGTFGTSTGTGTMIDPVRGGMAPPGVDLTSIVSAIPLAQDGQLITSAHHNIMRTALFAIAAQLGGSGGGGLEITTTVAPAFHQLMAPPATGGQPVNVPLWAMTAGIATNSAPAGTATVTDAAGWLPVNLSDGAHIETLRVMGSRTGAIGSLEFDLIRVPFDGHQVPVLIKVVGDTTTDPFSGPVRFDQSGLTSAVIQESTLIDNTKYLYVIQAIGRNIAAAAQVVIRGFQVTCTLS